MNVHIRPEGIGSPPAQTTEYVLGMPQLCPSGLSENWLWKELGHRHWELIAREIGRAAQGFGASGGSPTYAAFRRIALLDGDLGAVGENDALEVRSTLTRLSGTRVESRHVVAHRHGIVADVEMTSVFVSRQVHGVNRSIARVRIERPHGTAAFPDTRSVPSAKSAEERPALQQEPDEREIGTVSIEACPSLDFNGAGLLYFSSFVAAVDRAEWRLLGTRQPRSTTAERRALFHSNIEVGEDLVVQIRAAQDEEARRHRALISASSDGRLLAEITTRRAPRRPG